MDTGTGISYNFHVSQNISHVLIFSPQLFKSVKAPFSLMATQKQVQGQRGRQF